MADKGKKQAKIAKRTKKKVVKVFNGLEIEPCLVFLGEGKAKMYAMESKSGKLVKENDQYVLYDTVKTFSE